MRYGVTAISDGLFFLLIAAWVATHNCSKISLEILFESVVISNTSIICSHLGTMEMNRVVIEMAIVAQYTTLSNKSVVLHVRRITISCSQCVIHICDLND